MCLSNLHMDKEKLMTVFCICNLISLHSEGLLASFNSWSSTFPVFGCCPDGTSRWRLREKSVSHGNLYVCSQHTSFSNELSTADKQMFLKTCFPWHKIQSLKQNTPDFIPFLKYAVHCLWDNSFNVAVRDSNKHFWSDTQLAAVRCSVCFTVNIKRLWSSFCVLWRLKKWM